MLRRRCRLFDAVVTHGSSRQSASLRMMAILFLSNDLFCSLTFSAADRLSEKNKKNKKKINQFQSVTVVNGAAEELRRL